MRQSKKKTKKNVGYYDDQKLGFGQYEGGGERDQEFYNVAPLRKPQSDVIYTSEGPVPVVHEQVNKN